MDLPDGDVTKQQLAMIVEYHEALLAELGTEKFYTHLAGQLSALAQRKPAWGWRYVQSVASGTLYPSKAFSLAVEAYGATLDDAPAAMTYTVQVTVLARPGAVLEGSLVLGEAKPCAWPGCRVIFVPRVPWQRYCSLELHLQAKREKRSR